MADRYLVALARQPHEHDYYLLTPDEWTAFQARLNEGDDVCMAVSKTVGSDEDRDYLINLRAVFDLARKRRFKLVAGEIGIGY